MRSGKTGGDVGGAVLTVKKSVAMLLPSFDSAITLLASAVAVF